MKLSHLLLNSALGLLVWEILISAFLLLSQAQAGVFVCNANCLSKVASSVAIAANAKNLVAGAKRVRHLKKSTKANRP